MMFCKGLNDQLQLRERDFCLCSQEQIDDQNMLQKEPLPSGPSECSPFSSSRGLLLMHFALCLCSVQTA